MLIMKDIDAVSEFDEEEEKVNRSEDQVEESEMGLDAPDELVSENEGETVTRMSADASGALQPETISKEEFNSLRNEIEQMKNQLLGTQQAVNNLSSVQGPIPTGTEEVRDVEPADFNKYQGLEIRLDEIEEQINNTQASLSNQIDSIQEQANDIESGLGLLTERVNIGAGGVQQDFVGLDELYKKVEKMSCDMEILSNTSAKLMHDAEEKNNQLQALTVQIETLERSKADREELDEALLDKADKTAVKRKVSQDQFENALEYLSLALQDAVKKLAEQEEFWHDALDEFQAEIASKLDKREMGPMKEFINKKLRMLHKKLKSLTNIRRQAEAAVAKKDLIKDITCLSCDLNAVMPRQLEGNVPLPPAATPHHNIKPYLTYELDMIRKENRRLPPKNVVRLEEALLNDKRAKARDSERKSVITKWDHLCQRYCGGSHTTTVPHQRVTRVGNVVTCAGGGLEVFRLFPEKGPGAKREGAGKANNSDPHKQAKQSHITRGNKN